MGQNVNYLLGNQSQLLGADPEQYRQQLIQQEQQRIGALAPNLQLGAQLGGILGRGLTNVAQDRGFFEVTNPVLQKLTGIQEAYNIASKDSDPNDPMAFYTKLQAELSNRGYGQQALMAAQEAKKFEGIDVKSKSDLADLYAKDPGELSNAIARATEKGDAAAIKKLTTLQETIEKKRGLDLAKEQAQIGLINAQSEQAKAAASKYAQDIESGKFDFKVINDITGTPTSIVKIDKKTGETTVVPLPGQTAPIPGAPAPATPPPSSAWKIVPTPVPGATK